MDARLGKALRRDESKVEDIAPLMGLEAVPARGPAPTPRYGLDPTGDFEITDIGADQVVALQPQLTEDPEAVLASARHLWDGERAK